MILTGPKIREQVSLGNIKIDPFDENLLNPNSYDFRLGHTLRVYDEPILDSRIDNKTTAFPIPETGFVLKPDVLYLGHTFEIMGSDHFVPIIRGKSSTGRVGLFIHITADLVDIGFFGNLTLMMHAVQPVKVYPGMRIGQITFWRVFGDVNLYNGKYQGSIGPVSSQVFQDFKHKP